MTGNHIRQTTSILNNRHRHHSLRRYLLAGLYPLLKFMNHNPYQSLHFGGFDNWIFVFTNLSLYKLAFLLIDLYNLASMKALYQHSYCTIRQLYQMLNLCHSTYIVKILYFRLLHICIPLSQQKYMMLLLQHGLFQSRNRGISTCIQMYHHIWKYHHPPQGKNR